MRKSGGLVRKSEVLIREMCFGGPVAPLSAKQTLKTNSIATQLLNTNYNASGNVGRQHNVSFPNVCVCCVLFVVLGCVGLFEQILAVLGCA